MLHKNLIKFQTGGVYVTLYSRLNFGTYVGETIEFILSIDSKYIIQLYRSGKLKPDEKLKTIIQETIKEIEEHYGNRKNF